MVDIARGLPFGSNAPTSNAPRLGGCKRPVEVAHEREIGRGSPDGCGGHVDVLGGVERNHRSHRGSEVPGPETAAEDDAFRLHVAAVGDHAGDPWGVGRPADPQPQDLHALPDGDSCVGAHRTMAAANGAGVDHGIAGLVQGHEDALGRRQRVHAGDLLRGEHPRLDTVVAGDRRMARRTSTRPG